MKLSDFYRNKDDHKRFCRTVYIGENRELQYTKFKDLVAPAFSATVSDILATQWTGSIIYSAEEEYYYLNFIQNYRIAKITYKHKEYRDALLFLHLSYEMLLKHIISKTIHYNARVNRQPAPNVLLDVFGSHDIPLISKSLMLVLSDFRTPNLLASHAEINVMKNQLGRWPQIRYSNPSAANYTKCKNIYSKLEPIIKTFYFDLKSKGKLRWT